jgi:hypothetical protein
MLSRMGFCIHQGEVAKVVRYPVVNSTGLLLEEQEFSPWHSQLSLLVVLEVGQLFLLQYSDKLCHPF